jgi:chromosome segregation ATPase
MKDHSISVLNKIQKSIDKSFETIDSKIKSYEKAKKEEKSSIKSLIIKEMKNIEISIKIMEAEHKATWEETISEYKCKLKEYKTKKQLIKIILKNKTENNNNYLDPNAKVDLDQLNLQQVIDRMDAIINEDDQIISNIIQTLDVDVKTMKEANRLLKEQKEKLSGVSNNLKEVDFSIHRAKNKITSMFKIYASDRFIICLIVAILIIIVTIIIISSCGGDNKNNFNIPYDIFGNNNANDTNDKVSNFAFCLNNNTFKVMLLISLILLYFK